MRICRCCPIAAVALLALVGGCVPSSFLITPVTNTRTLREETVQSGRGFGGGKIAIIEVEGNIGGGGGILPTLGGENRLSLFAQQLDAAERDRAVKAVVLRINSPGGTVSGSDTIYELVMKFKERSKKPVIASAQDVAASGAYYISCASDVIVARSTSIVGSIGVIFNAVQADGLLEKIGVRVDAIKSGPNKDLGSPFKKLSPGDQALMQQLIDEFYARFLAIVRKKTNITNEADFKIATDGRVFTGDGALKLGLIDRVGSLEDAIDVAREKSNSPAAKVILYKRPYGPGGSVYASGQEIRPQANTIRLPEADALLPGGFYYLWRR